MIGVVIELADARRLIAERCSPLGSERVPLPEALGRVLAEPAVSPAAVPGFDNSAMDGFAVRAADVRSASPAAVVVLDLAGESSAGSPASDALEPGQAIAVSTGAMLPAGADSVVPLEHASRANGRVELTAGTEPGAFVRRAGEDLGPGATPIEPGTRIGPAELGVLAAIGAEPVTCARRPIVSVLTTGEELRDPGEELGPGEVHDASALTIPALAGRAGAAVARAERIGDDRDATVAALERATDADLTVICGGVSVGPHDHVRPALEAIGAEEIFWGIALRPGKPTWFGTSPAGSLVFGLPGNPVSAMVTFHALARPAILRLLGADPRPTTATAVLETGLPAVQGRAHLARCRLEWRDDGLRAHPAPAQGSHVLTSMLGADAIAILPSEHSGAEAGDRVTVELLDTCPR
jgi:molybdopterin molybdotransferase